MKITNCVLTAMALAGAALAPTARANNLRTVALSATAVPGVDSGVTFRDMNAPSINNSGQVAFRGRLTGTGVVSSNDRGIWSEGSGAGLSLVAREGNPATDLAAGVVYGSPNSVVLNDTGETAFKMTLGGTGITSANNAASWSEGGGSLAIVAREGNAATGTSSGYVLGSFDNPVINDSGATASLGYLSGTSSSRMVWSSGSGSAVVVAHQGSQVPGTTAGITFRDGFSTPSLNNPGHVAFFGNFEGTGVDNSNDRGVFSNVSGSLSLIAREGSQAAGLASGVLYGGGLDSPRLNSADQIAFGTSLTGTGITGANDYAIWSDVSGSLAVVVREGDQATGLASGVTLTSVSGPVLNATGNIAFQSYLTGTGVTGSNNVSLWETDGSSLELVVRTGDQAPGTPAGVSFSSFNGNSLNGVGQTLFHGTLTGTGVTTANDNGIWAEDETGQLTLIAREGDIMDLDSGPGIDLRTIESISFDVGSGNEDGFSSGFNDLGQVAFMVDFTDTSLGVFVSDAVMTTVPEPSSLVLVGLFGLGMSLRRNRK